MLPRRKSRRLCFALQKTWWLIVAASHCKASYLSSTGMPTRVSLKVNDFSEYKEICVSVLKQCDLCVDEGDLFNI